MYSLFLIDARNNFMSLYTPSILFTKSSSDRLPSRSGRSKRIRDSSFPWLSVPSFRIAIRARTSNFKMSLSGVGKSRRWYTSWLLTTILARVVTSPHAIPNIKSLSSRLNELRNCKMLDIVTFSCTSPSASGSSHAPNNSMMRVRCDWSKWPRNKSVCRVLTISPPLYISSLPSTKDCRSAASKSSLSILAGKLLCKMTLNASLLIPIFRPAPPFVS